MHMLSIHINKLNLMWSPYSNMSAVIAQITFGNFFELFKFKSLHFISIICRQSLDSQWVIQCLLCLCCEVWGNYSWMRGTVTVLYEIFTASVPPFRLGPVIWFRRWWFCWTTLNIITYSAVYQFQWLRQGKDLTLKKSLETDWPPLEPLKLNLFQHQGNCWHPTCICVSIRNMQYMQFSTFSSTSSTECTDNKGSQNLSWN